MCERGINRKYVNYTTVRTGRAHHAGNTTLSASFQTLVCSDFVSNKRNPGNGLFETSVFVVSCARLCRNRTVPALRSGCACSLPSVGIAHLTSLNSPCRTGHIASTTNDKLYLSSFFWLTPIHRIPSSLAHLSSSAPALVRALVIARLITCNAPRHSYLTRASICQPMPRASLTSPASSPCCTGLRHHAACHHALRHRPPRHPSSGQ